MLRMKSPKPDRRGRYEERDVPGRRVKQFKARGWVEVKDNDIQEDVSEEGVFDISGNWFSVRTEVRDLLGKDSLPGSKKQAVQWLEEAGYKVVGE
jgi:hypothetical protein